MPSSVLTHFGAPSGSWKCGAVPLHMPRKPDDASSWFLTQSRRPVTKTAWAGCLYARSFGTHSVRNATRAWFELHACVPETGLHYDSLRSCNKKETGLSFLRQIYSRAILTALQRGLYETQVQTASASFPALVVSLTAEDPEILRPR